MKLPISLRVFLAFALVILASVLSFTVYTLRVARSESERGLSSALERTAEAAGAAVQGLEEPTGAAGAAVQGRAQPGSSAELEALVRNIGAAAQARITVMDSHGTVLADSEQDPAGMENHAGRPEVAQALAGSVGAAVRFSSTLSRDMLYVAVPVPQGAAPTLIVRASAPRTVLDEAWAKLTGPLAVFSLILLGVSLAVALLVSRSILLPLARLSVTVNRFAEGDFSARILLRGRDEVAGLASRFNGMAEKVQELFRQVTISTQELDGIFSSVTQGIALLDKGGRIARANPAFAEIVGTAEVTGKRVWEVSHAPRLIEAIDRARMDGASPGGQIEIGDKLYLCTVTKMADDGGLIVVLLDVSEPSRLEEIKRDFVTNASHELRTPLTAIRGFLELLEPDESGENAKWLDAVRRNTDRMTAIVEDLLHLSRLEGVHPDFSPSRVDLCRLVREAAEPFIRRAEEKGLALVLQTPDDLPPIQGDAFQLEQMLVNLIDNAVKYTESGQIRVSCLREDGRVILEVADTGIGIAEEHRDRIFERFYVVDKSRSRRLGGTGLGLSLVKHIVMLHGGGIEVESAPGEGSRFIVSIPAR